MPYNEHELLKFLKEENQKIWKYYDFYKFLFLIENSSFHFTKLNEFEDPLEGNLTNATINRLRKQAKIDKKEEVEEFITSYKEWLDKGLIAVSCWCRSNNESYHLWKSYGNEKYSVCLQSTIGKLIASVENTKEQIIFADVQYKDYNEFDIFEKTKTNFIFAASYKDIPYKDDKELRLLLFSESNLDIIINLEKLIDKIILSPLMNPWEKKIIKALLKKYSLDNNVIDSSIPLKKITYNSI